MTASDLLREFERLEPGTAVDPDLLGPEAVPIITDLIASGRLVMTPRGVTLADVGVEPGFRVPG